MEFGEYMQNRFTEAGIGLLFVLAVATVIIVAKLAIDIKHRQKEHLRRKRERS